MTEPQALSLGLLLVTGAVLAGTRWPADLVALAALLAGVMGGAVPAAAAFGGFGNPAVVVLAALTLLSAAVARSGATETLLRPLLRRAGRERAGRADEARGPGGRGAEFAALAVAAALLAAVTRGRGAVAALLPFAAQAAQRTRSAPEAVLLPVAFAAMAGGLVTLVGSAANLLVAQARAAAGAPPFALFDFAPVGLGVAATVVLALWAGDRLFADRRGPAVGPGAQARGVVAEARLPADSPFAGRPLAELEDAGSAGAVRVTAVLRERFRRVALGPDTVLRDDDVLLLAGEPDELERLIATAGLVLAGAGDEGDAGERALAADATVREGVVTGGSPLVGATVRDAALRSRHGVSLLALGRRDGAVTRRLRFERLRPGDVLVLRGPGERAADAMEALRVLPLSERPVALGARHRSWVPALVLAGAIALAALGAAPVPVAFVGAALLVLAMRVVSPDEAYRAVEWPGVVMLAALIPLGEAARGSGASDLVAAGLAPALAGWPGAMVAALLVAVATLAGSFADAGLAALVLAPVAAALAPRLGLGRDGLLMAVAVGAAGGFLSPYGRRCAVLADAPVGWRRGRHRRLALPLALAAAAAGTALIALVWGFAPAPGGGGGAR